MGRMFFVILLALLVPAVAAWAEPPRAPDLVLEGVLTRAEHQTYTEVPFKVPAGVERITVAFAYAGKAERSVIDLGLRDPERFRGWSGGNKASFTLAESDATPSYLAGPLKAGTWRLVLGAPNIRQGSRAAYTARIWFDRAGTPFAGFGETPVASGPRWWRGDLHMHTGHSDGSCLSRKGVKVPCPAFKTAEAAVARGLDFIAVTDHNATAQFDALREIAPYYDDLLIIPGREITTFQGHANVFGPTGPLDFQLGGPRAPTFKTILDQVEAAHGLISINHPALPSGELCMGCGWTIPSTDYSRIPAVEVINGGFSEGPLSGLAFWEARLNAGHRITAIGGSDNHDPNLDPAKAPAIGVPTTVVQAPELSQEAILAAIRRGHVFVDVQGSADRELEVTATLGEASAGMGDSLTAPAGARVRIGVRTRAVQGATLSLAGPAAGLAGLNDPRILTPDQITTFDLVSNGARGWLRVDVRGADGKLLILGNPIYFNPAP